MEDLVCCDRKRLVVADNNLQGVACESQHLVAENLVVDSLDCPIAAVGLDRVRQRLEASAEMEKRLPSADKVAAGSDRNLDLKLGRKVGESKKQMR